jgi:hypothetical protein
MCSVNVMSMFLTESLVEFLQVAERQPCGVAGFTQCQVADTFFYDVAIAIIHNIKLSIILFKILTHGCSKFKKNCHLATYEHIQLTEILVGHSQWYIFLETGLKVF